jgi:hypothetical protein
MLDNQSENSFSIALKQPNRSLARFVRKNASNIAFLTCLGHLGRCDTDRRMVSINQGKYIRGNIVRDVAVNIANVNTA